MLPRRSPAGREAGFTLLELMIVVSILGILATIGVPQYVSALRTARVGKTKHELVTIAHAIDAFTARNDGQLPLTLFEVGFGGKRDPWGTPYCYLNYGAGCGDGLEWAIEVGLVDPGAFLGDESVAQGGRAAGATRARRGSVFGLARNASVARASLPQEVDAADAPPGLATEVAARIANGLTPKQVASLADAVRNNDSFGMFAGVEVEPTRRRDRYMFPLNTDYDLFSLGPDAATAASLGERVGLDDVIRANNGGYFGPASEY